MIFAFQEPLEIGKVYTDLELRHPNIPGDRQVIPFQVIRPSTREEWATTYEFPEHVARDKQRHIAGGYDHYYLLSLD